MAGDSLGIEQSPLSKEVYKGLLEDPDRSVIYFLATEVWQEKEKLKSITKSTRENSKNDIARKVLDLHAGGTPFRIDYRSEKYDGRISILAEHLVDLVTIRVSPGSKESEIAAASLETRRRTLMHARVYVLLDEAKQILDSVVSHLAPPEESSASPRRR